MPKRKGQFSGKRSFDTDDNPIDLTGAFAPVKGPQSVDYDYEDDPVGLTSAFGVVPPEDLDDRTWDEDNKWDGFNWSESPQTDDEEADAETEESAVVEEADFVILDEDQDDEADNTDKKKPHKSSRSHKDLSLHEARMAEKEEEAEEDIEDEFFDEEEFLDDEDAELIEQAEEEEEEAQKTKAKRSKHGAHAAPAADLSPRMMKSKRIRRVLIVLVILLICVLGVLGYFAYETILNSQQEAAKQTQDNETPTEATTIDQSSDATDTKTRLADVPDLAQLLNMTQDEAIAAIGHGALVTSNRDVNEEGSPIKVLLNITLADEAGNSRTGTPTVYLGLGEDGRVKQAGYSASATSLGFSSLSFVDAINTEHVIEKTLGKAGVNVPENSAVLPEDKATYTTYANDGTTIVRESCSFDGDVDVNGIPCVWSAVLSYDYTTQIVSGNLNDTVRIIYVYITQK